MNWKEQLDKEFPNGLDTEVIGIMGDGINIEKCTDKVKDFIARKIISNIIEDICSHQCTSDCRRDGCNCVHEGMCIDMKDELKEKWL